MHKRLSAFIVFSQFLLVACQTDGTDAKAQGSAGDFRSEILAHVSSEAFSFTFDYEAPPPEGRLLHVTSVSGVESPCSLFKGAAPPTHFDALSITTGSATLTSYAIKSDRNGLGESDASVTWSQVRDEKQAAKFSAVSGTVELLAGPANEEEWGKSAKFKVSADFERDPVLRSACEGGQDMTTGEIVSTCQCERASGEQFFCDGAQGWCCQSKVGDSFHVEFIVEASACAEQCSFTSPELARHCRDLPRASGGL